MRALSFHCLLVLAFLRRNEEPVNAGVLAVDIGSRGYQWTNTKMAAALAYLDVLSDCVAPHAAQGRLWRSPLTLDRLPSVSWTELELAGQLATKSMSCAGLGGVVR